MLMSTDDTKLSSKYLLKPIIVYSEKNDFRMFTKVILGLINPGKISKMLEYNTDSSSKKDLIKTQVELISTCIEDIKGILNVHTERFLLEKDLTIFLIDLADFLNQYEMSCIGEGTTKSQLPGLLSYLLETIFGFISYDFENNSEKMLFDKIGHFSIVQLIKKLIPKVRFHAKDLPCVKDFIESFSSLIKLNLEAFLKSKGVFIVLAIFEDDVYKSLIIKELKANKALLEKIYKDDEKSSVVSIIIKQLK